MIKVTKWKQYSTQIAPKNGLSGNKQWKHRKRSWKTDKDNKESGERRLPLKESKEETADPMRTRASKRGKPRNRWELSLWNIIYMQTERERWGWTRGFWGKPGKYWFFILFMVLIKKINKQKTEMNNSPSFLFPCVSFFYLYVTENIHRKIGFARGNFTDTGQFSCCPILIRICI